MSLLYLNQLKPVPGTKSAPKRLGRGIGSGLGKTAGRGHKGQHARAGGFHKLGFEGGQTPLQRRLPKFGFHSRRQRFAGSVHLGALEKLSSEIIDCQLLKSAGLVDARVKNIKVIATGTLNKPVKLKGIKASLTARKAIEALGGTVD